MVTAEEVLTISSSRGPVDDLAGTVQGDVGATSSTSGTDGTTALFVANDTMALGVLHALHVRGLRVPRDVSVVGFDNAPDSAHYWPALTTVDQDLARLGREAVNLVIRSLAGEQSPSTGLIPPALVVRSSTSTPLAGRQ